MKSNLFLIAFAHCPTIGPRRLHDLRAFFGDDLFQCWTASRVDLLRAGLSEKVADHFLEERAKVIPERAHEEMIAKGVEAISKDDEQYPENLKEVYDAPFILFMRGKMPPQECVRLAVVGTRKLTAYGLHITQPLVGELARAGIVIVSGLALGIDALAHTATLASKGVTIAVLGAGVDSDSIYPRSHSVLADQIVDTGGCLLSEYPVGTHPQKSFFPARNRIAAGMSAGVLVIEAPEQSGALITARLALDYNRDVFAVPGPITSPGSKGSNDLLKKGATVVTCAQDIFDQLAYPDALRVRALKSDRQAPSEQEQRILNVLSHASLHVDEIAQTLQLDIQAANSTLLVMEIKGMVKDIGQMTYVKLD